MAAPGDCNQGAMDRRLVRVSHRAMDARTSARLLATLLLAGCAGAPPSNPQGDAALQNTNWKLAVLASVPVTYYPGERHMNLVLQPDGRMTGFSGCNRLAGGYTLQGDRLSLAPVASTRMTCEQRDSQERFFLAMMSRVSRWRVMGAWLELSEDNGAVVARFEAAGR